MDFLNKISKKQIIMLITALIIAAVIPLTVLISQKQQELRQRAAETSAPLVSFYFTKASDPTKKLDNLSISPKASMVLNLYMVNGLNNINGFDITINGDSNLKISSLSEGLDASKFNEVIIKSVDVFHNNARFSKVNSNTGTIINGNLLLASISVTAIDNAIPNTTGSMSISNANVTSPSNTSNYVSIDSSSLNLPYTISALPPTPTPTPISYRKEGDGNIVPNISLPPGQLITLNFRGVTLPGISSSFQSTALKLTFFRGDNSQQVSGGPFIANIPRQAGGSTTGEIPFSGNFTFRASDLGLPAGLQDYFIQIGANSYQAKMLAQNGARTNDQIGSQGLTGLTPIKIYSTGETSTIPTVILSPGDINDNGIIDGADYGILVACFGNKNIFTGATGRTDCGKKSDNGQFNPDINKDGKVAGDDINLLWKSVNGTL